MIQDIKRHPVDYSILTVYALTSFVLMILYQDPQKRLLVSGCFALYYFIWAIFHHVMIGKITLAVVLEYLLVTILGFVTLQVIFFPIL